MKIVHISPLYYPCIGGAEFHLKEVCEGLAKRGHDITVLTSNIRRSSDLWKGVSGGLPEVESINRVKIIRLEPEGGALGKIVRRSLDLPGGCRLFNRILSPSGLDHFTQGPRTYGVIPWVYKSGADLVVTMNWYWPPAYYAYLARRLKTFKLVGIPLFHTFEDWSNRDVYSSMLKYCDAVVTNTAHEADFASRPGAKTVFPVGVGIHPQAFDRKDGQGLRAAYDLGGKPVVGFVGRPTGNKGVGTVIEAMKYVWKWNSEVALVLAGPDASSSGVDEIRLHELTPLERARVVRICNFSDEEKASIFDALDVFVLPSVGESFGIAYLEAWMCGKPVIGARIGPTSDVIDDGVDGLLAKPDDPGDLAAKLLELLSDPGKRERMGQNGRTKTLKRFTWDRIIDKTEQVYRHVVDGAPRSSGASGLF
mgnify:CR=1 FL=1